MGAPFGVVDTPADGAGGVTGAIAVTGWALDDTTVQAVEVWRDAVSGEPVGAALRGDGDLRGRERVPTSPPRTRPTRTPTARGGATCCSPTCLPARGNGTFPLHACAIDGEGTRTLLGSRTITCTNATATKPFGTIDTPGQGQTVSGSGYVVLRLGADAAAGSDPDGRLDDLADDRRHAHRPPGLRPVPLGHRDGASRATRTRTGRWGTPCSTRRRSTNGIHTIAWLGDRRPGTGRRHSAAATSGSRTEPHLARRSVSAVQPMQDRREDHPAQ